MGREKTNYLPMLVIAGTLSGIGVSITGGNSIK